MISKSILIGHLIRVLSAFVRAFSVRSAQLTDKLMTETPATYVALFNSTLGDHHESFELPPDTEVVPTLAKCNGHQLCSDIRYGYIGEEGKWVDAAGMYSTSPKCHFFWRL